MLAVFAMGWHGTITLENIIAWRDRSHLLLAEHPVLSVLVYVLIYVTVATLSLPGGLVLTLAGGLLFGTLVGGIAAIVGATIGATLVFLAGSGGGFITSRTLHVDGGRALYDR
jgi:uncharacterized membrane protein YdjX (TVP38/TMEM64 family)